MTLIDFRGNCPKNVSKDAKYTIRRGESGSLVVAIIYETKEGEKWYASTEDHPELVRLIGAVKEACDQPPLGSFYINEYKQVIVPVTGTTKYYLAGTYDKPLRFTFEDKVLSGEPRDLSGKTLTPGNEWTGPHPGIPYVLTAGGNDIKYTKEPRPNVTQDILLSRAVGRDTAKIVADMIRKIKGYEGGRFYVNEFCSMFTPMTQGEEFKYVYIGQLDLTKWFPDPHMKP